MIKHALESRSNLPSVACFCRRVWEKLSVFPEQSGEEMGYCAEFRSCFFK